MKEDQPCSSSSHQAKKRQVEVVLEDSDKDSTPPKHPRIKDQDNGEQDGCEAPMDADGQERVDPSREPNNERESAENSQDEQDEDTGEKGYSEEDDPLSDDTAGSTGNAEARKAGESASKPIDVDALPDKPDSDSGEPRPVKTEPKSAREMIDDIPPLTAKPGDAAEPGSSLVNKDPRALHLKLLFKATVRCGNEASESAPMRRRTFSDSYRPEAVPSPPVTRNKNDAMFFIMPRTSYSLDDLTEVFPNSKLDYFLPTKTYPRKYVRIENERPAPKPRFPAEVNFDFAQRGLARRCQCPECDHSSVELLPALTLYPTDRRGQTDYGASRRYGFQARLVRPHPRSYRTARGGHMQWCRYEEDVIKLPLCLQFEVAFTAPDRHRIKLDIPRSVENAPTDIAELGFFFDDDGILKEKDTNTSGFYYVKDRLDKDKRRSRYILAVLGSYNYVSNLMIRENMRVVRKQILRLNGLYDVYSPTIYLSEEAGRRDKLIVLVASKRVARPGVWSVRTLLHREGGINIGSMLPYIRQAHKEEYSVLVANPNENHFVHPNLVDISHIPKHSSPAEHLASLWAEEIIPASYARHVYLVLHETAYQAFFSPLIRERPRLRETHFEMERTREEFFQQLQDRVRGVVLIGAVPQLGMNLALKPEMTQWMLENIINFVPSTEPPETFLKTHRYGQITDIRRLSSGTKDHDRIPETVRSVVFRFFASQQRRWTRKSSDITSSTPLATSPSNAEPSTSAQPSDSNDS